MSATPHLLPCPLVSAGSPSGRPDDPPGWTIGRVGPANIDAELRPPRTRPSFWLGEETLQFLGGRDFGMSTQVWQVCHAATGRHFGFTTQVFAFRPTRQAAAGAGKVSTLDVRRRLLRPFAPRVLVFGQLLTSGPYFFTGGLPEAISLPALIDAVAARAPHHHAVVVKDAFYAGSTPEADLIDAGFHPLPVDPVMVVNDLQRWDTVADYLGDLSSKYRVRHRRARKKMAALTHRRLSATEVRDRISTLFELYAGMQSTADFNLVELTPEYFHWLANHAYFEGYFDGAELIGYSTAIPNGNTLHAHFLGLKPAYKRSHHLYHNVLLDLLAYAIENNFSRLDYGRTALEIKSSVGAKAQQFSTLLRVNNLLLNHLVPRFTPAVFTPRDWTPRNPYRLGTT